MFREAQASPGLQREPGAALPGAWVERAVVQAGAGRAGEASLPSCASRAKSPAGPRLAERELCAQRPLVPRSCHCGSARALARSDHKEVITKTPGTAARLHLQSPGVLVPWTPGRRPRAGWLQVFISLAKLCLKRGARPWPRGARCAYSKRAARVLPRSLGP